MSASSNDYLPYSWLTFEHIQNLPKYLPTLQVDDVNLTIKEILGIKFAGCIYPVPVCCSDMNEFFAEINDYIDESDAELQIIVNYFSGNSSIHDVMSMNIDNLKTELLLHDIIHLELDYVPIKSRSYTFGVCKTLYMEYITSIPDDFDGTHISHINAHFILEHKLFPKHDSPDYINPHEYNTRSDIGSSRTIPRTPNEYKRFVSYSRRARAIIDDLAYDMNK